MKVPYLLLRDLDLVETAGDLLECQEASLTPIRDEVSQLLDLQERCIGLLGQ
jgi:hypothetical protein